MTPAVGRVVFLEIVGIIDDQTTLKSSVGLQGKTIEQRDYGVSGRRLTWQRRPVFFPMVIRHCHRRLTTGAEELNLFTLDQCGVMVVPLQQRINERHRQVHQKCVIGNLIDGGFGDDPPVLFRNERGDATPGGAALRQRAPRPQFDLAGHHLFAARHALLPIVQHSCFVQTILHSPQPYVAQPLENPLPGPASAGQAAVFVPFLPHRQDYSQGVLVREQHEQASTESLVGASYSAVRDFEEIVIRRNIRLLDLGKPFHSRDFLYRADEMLDRVDGLQDDDLLGNEVMGLRLHAHASCFQRLLQSVELRIQPFGLPHATRKVRCASATAPPAAGKRLTGTRQNQQRAFRHRSRPLAPSDGSSPARAVAIVSAAP